MEQQTGRNGLETEAERIEREMAELARRYPTAGPAQTAWKAADIARGLYTQMLKVD